MQATSRPAPNFPGPPDVLVDAERLDALEPVGAIGSAAGFDLERVPQRVPGNAQPAGERPWRRRGRC